MAELFSGSKKLIKGSAGTTAIYYHDSEAEIASPSTDLLTASAANATALASWGRQKNKSIQELLDLFGANTAMSKLPLNEIKNGVMEQLFVILGINSLTNDLEYRRIDAVPAVLAVAAATNRPAVAAADAVPAYYTYVLGTTATAKLYVKPAEPGYWVTVGSTTDKTFSYLNITAENQKAIVAELMKPTISIYSKYCL